MRSAKFSTRGRPSAAKLARVIGRDVRTARRVLSGKQRLDFERPAQSETLWPYFLRCLYVSERKTWGRR